MKTIDITKILAPELKSRSRVADLNLFLINMQEMEVELDFAHVTFATRSFIDEFYNILLKDSPERRFKIHLVNVPEDIDKIFASVSRTQSGLKTIPPTANIQEFSTVQEMLDYMASVA